MKSIKFLLFLLFWLVCILVLYGYFSYGSTAAIKEDIGDISSKFDHIVEKITFYFSNAGSWNYLILVLLISVLTILFVINDLVLERWFRSRKKKTFIGGGFAWLGQRSSAFLLVILEFIIIANVFVLVFAHKRIFKGSDSISEKQIVLLLGTNKKLRDGSGENLYYTYRINAVVELYKEKKIRRIVISGDNGHAGYNEPADMKYSLISRGVPENLISLDFAGFRTLDSIVRLKEHFGVEKTLIVSQRFHVERALVLAWLYGIDAYGYPANGKMTTAMIYRELFAKPKALLDVFVFNMQPKYGKARLKSSIDFSNRRDLTFAGIVLTFVFFAGLLAVLFFKD